MKKYIIGLWNNAPENSEQQQRRAFFSFGFICFLVAHAEWDRGRGGGGGRV
jgi:hypothetical protein